MGRRFNKGENSRTGTDKTKDTFHRMNYLYQASNFMATKKELGGASRYYCYLMKKLSTRQVLRFDKKIKRACCKNCHSLLVPGHTQKTTVKTQPPTLIRTCTFCGGERRFVHQNRKTDTVKLLPGGPVQVFARGDENPHDILRWKEEVKNRETEQSAGGALTPGGMNRPPFPTHGSSNRSSTSTDDNNGNNSADCSQRKRQAPSSPSYGSSKRRTPSSPSYGSSSSSSPSSSLRHQTPRSPSYGGSLRR